MSPLSFQTLVFESTVFFLISLAKGGEKRGRGDTSAGHLGTTELSGPVRSPVLLKIRILPKAPAHSVPMSMPRCRPRVAGEH